MIGANLDYGLLKLDLAAIAKNVYSYFLPVNTAARRFVQVFEEHGIKITQIPRIVPTLTFDKLASGEALTSALNDEMLRQTAEFFGIRRAWLEAADNQIYETRWCYKAPERFVEDFYNCDTNGVAFPVAVVCGGTEINRSRPTPMALVLKDKVAQFDESEIVRYRIFGDSWDWSYFPARVQLKAIARATHLALQRSIPVHFTTKRQVEAIQQGMSVPWSLLEKFRDRDFALEDFALSQEESRRSKEAEEFPYVLEFMAKTRFSPERFGHMPSVGALPNEPMG